MLGASACSDLARCHALHPNPLTPSTLSPTTRSLVRPRPSVCAARWIDSRTPDAQDVALRDAVMRGLVHDALHDVVEAWAQAAACYHGCSCLRRIKVDLHARAGAHGPRRQLDVDLQPHALLKAIGYTWS
jgi:hypothetical protein